MKLIQNEKGEFIKVPLTEAEIVAMQPSAYEVAMQDWHEPNFPKRIRAGIELLDPVNPNLTQEVSDLIHKLYNYLLAQGLPEYEAEGEKMIYINVVKEQHSEFAKNIEGITIDPRPDPKDFE